MRSNTPDQPLLTRGITVLLTVMCGISIGSVYYAQPLLPDIGRALHVSEAAMGLVPMLTQIGIAIGVMLFLPLGDVVDDRKLILWLISAHVVALGLVASSRSSVMLNGASAIMGLTTVIPYLLPAYAAKLAPAAERGRVTGMLARGIFAGILLARTVSGYVGYFLAWHAVYWIALVAMVVMGILFSRKLPSTRPTLQLSYLQLMRSLVPLVVKEPRLRLATLTQGLMFGGFNAFWTTLAFYLETPQFHLPSYAAGLFGVVGVAGALSAPVFGKLADRRGSEFAVRLGTVVALAAWAVFGLAGGSVTGLIVGVLLLDLGITACHVSNQTIIYQLGTEVRSRVTTLYILGLFVGAAIFSRLSTVVWADWGWPGVCTMGFLVTLIAVLANVAPMVKRMARNRQYGA
jgi:predicted MFS family arabinose efflux permease